MVNSSAAGPPRKPASRPRRLHPPQQVRIIGGQWKRTPLPVLDREGLRPTPDRVRETVFNWLGHLLDGNWGAVRCLDLFAGTGALGFEAASRGAQQVTLVESDPAAVRQLEANRDKLQANQIEIVRSDVPRLLERMAAQGEAARSIDLIFADPPYGQGWLEKIVAPCQRLLRPAGLLYLEAEQAIQPEALPDWLLGWEVVRADRAGLVHFHLLRRAAAAPETPS